MGLSGQNRYEKLIEHVFLRHYQEGAREVPFTRIDIERAAEELGIRLPKNLGDLLYSFRYRSVLPGSIQALAPEGTTWVIRATGRSSYCFSATRQSRIVPSTSMAETKLPDATPGLISKYALSDEQALLAKLRYNRLIDVFTGVTCYSLQNHLRTTVPGMGQVETDEIYVGLDRRGVHYVFPVQAKGGRDSLSIVQIEQDMALCADKFPGLLCRPVAAQFMAPDLIALFELERQDDLIVVSNERHYRLVPSEEVTEQDLVTYRTRPL